MDFEIAFGIIYQSFNSIYEAKQQKGKQKTANRKILNSNNKLTFFIFRPILLAADDIECTNNINLLHTCGTILVFFVEYKHLGSARNSRSHLFYRISSDNVNLSYLPVCAGASLTVFDFAQDANAMPSLIELVIYVYNSNNAFRYDILPSI